MIPKCPDFLGRQVGQTEEYVSKLFFVHISVQGRQGRPNLDICQKFQRFFWILSYVNFCSIPDPKNQELPLFLCLEDFVKTPTQPQHITTSTPVAFEMIRLYTTTTSQPTKTGTPPQIWRYIKAGQYSPILNYTRQLSQTILDYYPRMKWTATLIYLRLSQKNI